MIHAAASAHSHRRRSGIPAVAMLTLAGLLASCGGGSSKQSTPDVTTTSSSTPITGKGAAAKTEAFVDIQTCDNNGGSGTSSGTVENQGTVATGYHLQIGFYDSATNALLGDASTNTESAEPGASATWAIAVSDLGHAELVCHVMTLEAGGGGATGTTATTTPRVEEFPCDLITQAEIETIAGNPLDPGDVATNHVTENDATWTDNECAWLSTQSGNPTEITLTVSRAADFPSQTVECPKIIGTTTAVSGVGTSAQWLYSDPGTETTVGQLRVCADNALIGVRVTGSISGSAHLAVARATAQKALAAL